MKVYRLEFLQPDGRWTGPCTAEYMNAHAYELRDTMLAFQKTSSAHPVPGSQIFADNPGKDRYVCATTSMKKLTAWFGAYLELFIEEGGHVAVYEVPLVAIGAQDGYQVIYQQRQGKLVSRKGKGHPLPVNLVERIHPGKRPE